MSTTAIIMDIATGAVLLGFGIYGAWRGLFRSVAGLLVILAALVGACVLTSVLTPAVSEVLQPVIEHRVQRKVDSALGIGEDTGDVSAVKPTLPAEGAADSAESPEDTEDGLLSQPELSNLLRIIGMDGDPTEHIRDAAQAKARDTGVTLAVAVIESVAETVLRTLIFALSFAVLVLILKLITHAVDLALKLPGLHLLNRCGGLGIGVIEGALVLFLGIWLLRRLGVIFDTETVESTVLLSFFTTHTPLSVLSFL